MPRRSAEKFAVKFDDEVFLRLLSSSLFSLFARSHFFKVRSVSEKLGSSKVWTEKFSLQALGRCLAVFLVP